MPTAQEIFASTIRNLPPDERLRLAALILDDLTKSGIILSDDKLSWDEEDIRDLTAFSVRHAAVSYPDEDDLA